MILVSVPAHGVARACKSHFGRHAVRLRRQSIRSWAAYSGQLNAGDADTGDVSTGNVSTGNVSTGNVSNGGSDLLLFVSDCSATQMAATWGYMIGRFGESAPLVACHIDWLATARLCLLYRMLPSSGGRGYYSDLLVNPGLPEAETHDARMLAFGEMASRLLAPHQWHCLGLPVPTANEPNTDKQGAEGQGADKQPIATRHADFADTDFDLLLELLVASSALQRQPGYAISASEIEIAQSAARRLRLGSYQSGQIVQRVREYCVRFGRFPHHTLEHARSMAALQDDLRVEVGA